MYKVIDISGIAGLMCIAKPDIKEIKFEELNIICNRVSEKDPYITIRKSGKYLIHYADLAEINVQDVIPSINVLEDTIKRRFVREYYCLDSEMQNLLQEVINIYE